MKSYLITACKYGLGVVCLAFVIWQNWDSSPNGDPGLEEILSTYSIQWLPLATATAIVVVSLLLSFVRWYVLVRALDLPFTMTNAFRLGFLGFFWSTFFPGSVGGDAVKALYLAREQSRRTVAVATVLLDRAIGLWALFWFVAILGSFFWLVGDPALHAPPQRKLFDVEVGLQDMVLGAIGLVAFTSLLWTVLVFLPETRGEIFAGRLNRIPKVGGMAAEFWRAVWMYRSKQRSVAAAMLMALVGHIGWVTAFYYSAQVFQAPGKASTIPTLTEHFVIVPIGMTIQALFPAPGGIGGGEWGFGGLYWLIGKPKANGVVASLAARIISWTLALAGYIIYLAMPKTAERAERVPPTEEEPEPETTPNLSVTPAPSVSAD